MGTTMFYSRVLIVLSFLVAYCGAHGLGHAIRPVAHRRRDPSEKVFNVVQFGAVPNGKKDNALHFIRAWRAACEWKGKSRLLVPKGDFVAGTTIFQGPCRCQSPITVQIAGTVKALPDISNYEEDFWILFENINGLLVTGTGTIDGQGSSFWKYNNCAQHGGSCSSSFPISLKLNHVTNGIVRQISSVNPMGFHMAIVLSQNIRARNLHLFAPEDSPNTDGIHISQSNTVKIARSVIATGDDCVGIIQGSTDVSIQKVTCGPGHGFSIGSLGKYQQEKDVKGIIVRNCTLKNTQNGIRIKTWADSPPSQAVGMIFQDILMDGVKNPIVIDQLYGSSRSGKPSRVKISDVHFINIKGTSVSDVGVNLMCSNQFPCQNIRLSDINLKYAGTRRAPFTSTCANARVSYAGVQLPPPCR